jgi:NADH dehydrogenase FAD-containing subunit
MDIAKFSYIGTDYKERTILNWDGLRVAEIVIVDKTTPASHPLVYQLKEEGLTPELLLDFLRSRSKSYFFSKETFLFAGKAHSIDKQKKQIYLTNNSIIAYNALIIASGKKTTVSCVNNEEFAIALQILNDALRVKNKILTCLAHVHKRKGSFAITNRLRHPTTECPVEKIVHPHMAAKQKKIHTFDLDTLSSRFYEVQT